MGSVLEHLAVFFGAATGPLAARGQGIDLFGVIVLGFVTAVGGGTLRDVLLNEEVFWVHNAEFLFTAVLGAVVAFYLAEHLTRRRGWFDIPDALGLAFVTMLGTAKTLRLGHPPQICLAMGVMTGVAGGVIRDILLQRGPLVFRPEINLYATAAAAGSALYLVLQWGGWVTPQTGMLVGATAIFLLRVAAMRYRWRLPTIDRPTSSA